MPPAMVLKWNAKQGAMMPIPEEVDPQLIARVHHDVNNALTALIGQAQLLLREELSQTARRRVEIMEQTAKRIACAVDALRCKRIANSRGVRE